jgi:hypothetical protein
MAKIDGISSVTVFCDENNFMIKVNWTGKTDWKAQEAFQKLLNDSQINYAGSRNPEYDYLILNFTPPQENISSIVRIFLDQEYSVKRNGKVLTFS